MPKALALVAAHGSHNFVSLSVADTALPLGVGFNVEFTHSLGDGSALTECERSSCLDAARRAWSKYELRTRAVGGRSTRGAAVKDAHVE